MNKIIVGLLFIVLLGGGGYFIFRRVVVNKSEGGIPAGAVVIKMRDEDYQPSVVTIKKGQTVLFVNESKDARWPASNIHPTHEIYPEFDPKQPIVSGKSWSFTFDKAGEWRMHDHLAPYITGSVKVDE